MKTFSAYEEVSGMKPCRKRPIMVFCKQMQEPFCVDMLEGNYRQGNPGDYLIQGIHGELYICDKDIFEKTYDLED